MEFEFNQRIEISKIKNLLIGSKNETLQQYLSDEINQFLRTNSKDFFPSYERLFSQMCPKINFMKIEKIFEDLNENIYQELKGFDIINSNKCDDYFSSLIYVLAIKNVSQKIEKINLKFKDKIENLHEKVNKMNEKKKFTHQFKNQVEYILFHDYQIKSGNNNLDKNPNSDEQSKNINQGFSTFNIPNNRSSSNFMLNYSNQINKINNFTSVDSNTPTYSPNKINFFQQPSLKENFSQDRQESRGGNRPKTSTISKGPPIESYFIKVSEKSLTQNIWPKSKMLLSIASKMYREKYIIQEQRGILKELILDQDQNLFNLFNMYESTRNYQNLCDSICKLISYQSSD